jgi:hypothetical protein
MYTPVEQKDVEKKIHKFMARKSAWKTFSQTIADYLIPAGSSSKDEMIDISYEPLKWNHTGESLLKSRFQKAH